MPNSQVSTPRFLQALASLYVFQKLVPSSAELTSVIALWQVIEPQPLPLPRTRVRTLARRPLLAAQALWYWE